MAEDLPGSRRRGSRWWPLGAAAIVAMVLAIGFFNKGTSKGDEKGADVAVSVRVARVKRSESNQQISALGTVAAFNSVAIRPRIDGQIEKVGFSEGQAVRRGAVLFELDPRQLQSQYRAADAQTQRDEAMLENAKRDLRRYEGLAANDSIASQTVDAARAQVAQLVSTVAVDRAQADAARVQLDYAVIRSPIDGLTGQRQVDVGNVVHPTDATALVVVNQIQPIYVNSTFPAALVGELRAKLGNGVVAARAVDRQNGGLLDEGRLSLVDNQVDPVSGTVRVRAVFTNSHGVLWPGSFVDLVLDMGRLAHAFEVPTSALMAAETGSSVYVIGKDRKALLRPIKPISTSNTTAVVSEGLQEGDLVVTEGQFQLEPGATVRPIDDPAGSSGKGAHS